MPRLRPAPVSAALLFLALAFTVWAGVFVWKTSSIGLDGSRYFLQFEDAMIDMRYAWNLAHGNGLVWNLGERVEGFTDLLNVLLKAVLCLFLGKSAAVLAGQLVNIPFMLGAAWFAFRIARRISGEAAPRGTRWLPAAAFGATLFYYPLAYWAIGGMEPGLRAFLLLAAADQALSGWGDARVRPLLPVLLGLAFLSRPDSAVPAAIMMAYRWWGIRGKQGWARIAAAEAGIALALPVASQAFRLAYYGQWVPNTYTLKVAGIPLALQVANGLLFIGPFLHTVLPALALTAFGLALGWSRETAFLAGLFLAGIAVQVWSGGDFLPYWRMMCPFMPFLFILSIEGARRLAGLARPPAAAAALAAVAVAGSFLAVDWAFLGKQARAFDGEAYGVGVEPDKQALNVALFLKSVCLPSATAAVTRAGVIPYYSDLPGLDILGKTDAHVANTPPHLNLDPAPGEGYYTAGHNKWDLDYTITRLRPVFLMVTGVKFGQARPEVVPPEVANRYVALFPVFDGSPPLPRILLLRGSPEVDWLKVDRLLRSRRFEP